LTKQIFETFELLNFVEIPEKRTKMAGPITNRLRARFPPDSNCIEMKSIEKEDV
jgi:hypothetical protein